MVSVGVEISSTSPGGGTSGTGISTVCWHRGAVPGVVGGGISTSAVCGASAPARLGGMIVVYMLSTSSVSIPLGDLLAHEAMHIIYITHFGFYSPLGFTIRTTLDIDKWEYVEVSIPLWDLQAVDSS